MSLPPRRDPSGRHYRPLCREPAGLGQGERVTPPSRASQEARTWEPVLRLKSRPMHAAMERRLARASRRGPAAAKATTKTLRRPALRPLRLLPEGRESEGASRADKTTGSAELWLRAV